jgi:aquaporin Z
VHYLIATDKPCAELGSFAANGYDAHAPGQYGVVAALISEFVLTAVFLFIILGATSRRAPEGFAGLAIGLCLTQLHLVSIPITNTSVNPARSTGAALFAPDWAASQLWLFWVAPLCRRGMRALIYRRASDDNDGDFFNT